MQKHIIDEKTGIPYTLVGDYYLPWDDLPEDKPAQTPISMWERVSCGDLCEDKAPTELTGETNGIYGIPRSISDCYIVEEALSNEYSAEK